MTVILFEDKDPQICKLLWDAEENPLENYVIHAVFTSRELSRPISYQKLDNEKVLNMLPENQTIFPVQCQIILLSGVLTIHINGKEFHSVKDMKVYTRWKKSNLIGHVAIISYVVGYENRSATPSGRKLWPLKHLIQLREKLLCKIKIWI